MMSVPTYEIGRKEALEIATRHIARQQMRWVRVTNRLPSNVRLYGKSHFENCWFVLTSQGPAGFLTSSHLLVISHATGKILFDGSANDEG